MKLYYYNYLIFFIKVILGIDFSISVKHASNEIE